jgi:hypothetical protein
MGGNPIDPENLGAFRLFMFAAYLIGVMAIAYAVFGIVRTAATRLPIPRGEVLDPDLFLFDITSKLYSFSGRGRKVLKIVQFSLIGLFFLGGWLSVLYFTYQAADPLFGWYPNINAWLTVFFHLLLVLAVAVLFAIRARKHANRFGDTKPAV